MIALIPARGGSQRVKRKNMRMLGGHPLVAYAIASARNCGSFGGVYVSTEDADTAATAREYGAHVIERPYEYAEPDSPDIEWLRHAISDIRYEGHYMIVRPTSPFRTADTLKRAMQDWQFARDRWQAHSMRAISLVTEHPQKMWRVDLLERMRPYCTDGDYGHDRATQTLEPLWVQNGCLHVSTTNVLEHFGNYTGTRVAGFVTKGYEGLDINTENDLILAEALLERGLATLERI